LKKLLLIATIACLTATAAFAEGKVIGQVYGDYYHITKADAATADKGESGMVWRRIYLGYDYKFEKGYSARVRGQMDQGDLNTAAATTPYVLKDAYLKRKMGNYTLSMGLHGSSAWSMEEKHWGLRPVEKSPLDFHKFGSSRDQGLSFKGKALNKSIEYFLSIGNNASNKNETNRYKAYRAYIAFFPAKSLQFQLYYDKQDSGRGNTDQNMMKLFAGWKSKAARVGAVYATHEKKATSVTYKHSVMGLWGAYSLMPDCELFARYDIHEFDTDASVAGFGLNSKYLTSDVNAKKHTMLIFGMKHNLAKNVWIAPNIAMLSFDDKLAAATKTADDFMIARVTATFKF
jgi:hypothetical protein